MLLPMLGKQLKKISWRGLLGAREDSGASIRGPWVPPACRNTVELIQLLLAQKLECGLGNVNSSPFFGQILSDFNP